MTNLVAESGGNKGQFSMGYNKRRKTFTPRQVRAIVEELGVPGT